MGSPARQQLDHILVEARPRIAKHWSFCIQAGLNRVTPATVARVDELIDAYFENLKALPSGASTTAILGEMKTLFRRLDELNATCDGALLETDERELLVPIIIDAASAVGLNVKEFEHDDPTLPLRNF